jgi:hypothetical protein
MDLGRSVQLLLEAKAGAELYMPPHYGGPDTLLSKVHRKYCERSCHEPQAAALMRVLAEYDAGDNPHNRTLLVAALRGFRYITGLPDTCSDMVAAYVPGPWQELQEVEKQTLLGKAEESDEDHGGMFSLL